MNNEVTDWQDRVIGYRCFTCGEIVQSMWGNNCNDCTDRADYRRKMVALKEREVKALEALANTTPVNPPSKLRSK